MSLLSKQEAHLVGDIVSEFAQAHAFVGDMGREEFLADDKTVYAVEKAVQNVTEP